MLRSLRLLLLAIAMLLWLPHTASAFSFGSFAVGEEIQSIELSAALASGNSLVYDDTANTLTFTAAVSTITTNLQTYNLPIGDVVFSSQLMLSSESLIAPFAPFFGGSIDANFVNGIVADLTIVDVADAGNTLLQADYVAGLDLNVTQPGGTGLPIVGRLDSDFSVTGGDASFTGAFGSAGNYFSVLNNFVSSGVPVTTDLCGLFEPTCMTGESLDDFEVNPTATITPVSVPEPSFLGGLAILGGLWLIRRHTR